MYQRAQTFFSAGPPEFTNGTPKMENQTYPGHSILPNKPSFKPETITGPSVQPTTNQKASPQSANEVVDILFPKNDSSLQSVKGSPSNPKKVELPRYSKERIYPWNKYHGSI